jgi:hypothetical protein
MDTDEARRCGICLLQMIELESAKDLKFNGTNVDQ